MCCCTFTLTMHSIESTPSHWKYTNFNGAYLQAQPFLLTSRWCIFCSAFHWKQNNNILIYTEPPQTQWQTELQTEWQQIKQQSDRHNDSVTEGHTEKACTSLINVVIILTLRWSLRYLERRTFVDTCRRGCLAIKKRQEIFSVWTSNHIDV
jgi:hypothetical protein